MFHAIHNGVSAQLYPNTPIYGDKRLQFAIENGTGSYVYP